MSTATSRPPTGKSTASSSSRRGRRSACAARRLRTSLAAAACLAALCQAISRGAERDAAGDAGAGCVPLMMPGDFAALHGVAWRIEAAEPDPANPLLEGDMPWTAGGIMSHGTVLRDPLDGRWKAWLACTPAETHAEVASKNHNQRRICCFESADGVHWTWPRLGYYPFGEHRHTNIVVEDPHGGGAQYASVLVNPAQRPWPYEMFVYPHMYSRGGLHRYRSRDGRQWEHVEGPLAGPFTSDVCFIYRDAGAGYVSYFRLGRPDPGAHVPSYELGAGRTLYRSTSPTGREWTAPELIMQRDERDHRDTQYMECVPLRVPGGYVGLLTMYHPITQTLDLRWAASRDGRHWWQPDRRPCLANSPLGDYGGGMIWQSKDLIVDGDRLLVYYSGTEGIHRSIWDTRAKKLESIGLERVISKGAGFMPFNGALCRASFRLGRLYALVSAAGGPTVGTALSTSRDLAGKRLYVNLRTRPPKKSHQRGFDEGCLQAELVDGQGQPIPGFSREDCPPLRGDLAALLVRWARGDQAPPAARQVRFFLKRAMLYGFHLVNVER